VGRVTHAKQGPDIVTQIECGDGEVAYQEAKLDKSFGPGVTLNEIVSELVRATGLQVGIIKDLPVKVFQQGLSITGSVREQLNKIKRTFDVEWSIQDGNLNILKIGSSDNEEVIVLTPQTGLVGTPEETERGWKFRSLLQADIRPARRIRVESFAVTGNFVTEKVLHQGDLRGAEWISEVEAV